MWFRPILGCLQLSYLVNNDWFKYEDVQGIIKLGQPKNNSHLTFYLWNCSCIIIYRIFMYYRGSFHLYCSLSRLRTSTEPNMGVILVCMTAKEGLYNYIPAVSFVSCYNLFISSCHETWRLNIVTRMDCFLIVFYHGDGMIDEDSLLIFQLNSN